MSKDFNFFSFSGFFPLFLIRKKPSSAASDVEEKKCRVGLSGFIHVTYKLVDTFASTAVQNTSYKTEKSSYRANSIRSEDKGCLKEPFNLATQALS